MRILFICFFILFIFEFLFKEKTFEDQNGVPIELHGERYMDIHHAHELDVVQEHTNSFYDVDDVNDKKNNLQSFILKLILKFKV